jgi:hypothetical protein
VAALERGGADLIELGVPFSDPIADGPVIQQAAIARCARPAPRCQSARHRAEIRKRSEIPLLLFTYLNPVLRYGLENWRATRRPRHRRLPAHRRQRGRGRPYVKGDARADLDTVFLAAPTSTERAAETGGRIFQRLRLSGLAHRRHRRAADHCRFRAAADRSACAPSRICRWRWASAFRSRSTWRAKLAGKWWSGSGRQRHRAPDRALDPSKLEAFMRDLTRPIVRAAIS